MPDHGPQLPTIGRIGTRRVLRGGAPVLALVAIAALRASPAAATPSLEPTQEAREGIERLHRGEFAGAEAIFQRISRKNPTDPEGPFYESLTSWWRLLDDPKDVKRLATLTGNLDEAVRRGRTLIESGDAQRGRVLAGTALLLLAQTRAAGRRYFSAGSAARDGHRLLTDALERDPSSADAWFALGAYKYFAARLPFLVRALRVFVFIPGGDAEEGIQGLRRAADHSGLFGTEARLLLAYIASSDDEDDMPGAIEQIRLARAAQPSSALFAAIEARFLFALGRLAESERIAREALALAAATPGIAPEIPALARLRVALATYYQYRPHDALDTVAPLLGPDPPLPDDSIRTLGSLVSRLRADLGDAAVAAAWAGARPPVPEGDSMVAAAPLPPDGEASTAVERRLDGEGGAAIDTLLAAVARTPGDPITRYHLARAYQIEGRAGDAEAELRRVLAPGVRLPKTLQGWALIRMGAALESTGKRSEAEPFYRRGADLDGFIFRRAAKERLRRPLEPAPPPEG